MSNYNKATNFAVKDTLTSGDPDKVVSGAEIDNEFNAIASAVTSKTDKVPASTTNNFAALDANGNLKDSGKTDSSFADSTTTNNKFTAVESDVTSLQNDKADKVAAATTNNLASLDANGNLKDSGFPGNATVPSGGVIMWSGLISSIPTGWALCDGNNGTPDLRNRFIVGAGDQYDRNDTGGQNSVTLTVNEMPSHNHTGTPSFTLNSGDTEGISGRVTGAGSTNFTGGDAPHENRPPYFALAFIMKT